MAELGMTPHPTGSHVRLSPSPKGEGRKTTRLRVASNRRADWQVVLCARGARASSQGLCPPRLWRHEPQAKYNEEPPAKLVGSLFPQGTREFLLYRKKNRLRGSFSALFQFSSSHFFALDLENVLIASSL